MTKSAEQIKAALNFGDSNAKTDERLRELILYICEKSSDDPTFGATKLNKILFYSDFWAYMHLGHPITGASYQRLPQGPAPKRLLPVRLEMERNEELFVAEVPRHNYTQKRSVPLRPARLDVFSPTDLRFVDVVIGLFANDNARDVSEMSHDIVWRTLADGDLIPYQAAFVSSAEITLSDREWAGEIIHGRTQAA